MSRVKKHCSLLNYLKHADNDLYELIQELCIGRMLVPRRGTPGLAFLRPDKDLFKKIESMAAGDDPENAVDALQSCVILDHMPTIRDFDDKKSDIPTYRKKKLPVSGVDGKKVTLANGAEIVLDTKFQARKDRQNVTMYILSKQLVPVDTDDADFSNAKPKNNRKVKGGAEFAKTKRALFEQVLAGHSDPTVMAHRDPAMEVLVSLCDYLTEKEKHEELKAVRSQLSWDTLASLAIVLRPYADDDAYISSDITEWAALASTASGSHAHVYFSLDADMVGAYGAYMDDKDLDTVTQAVNAQQESIANMASKVTVIRDLENGFAKCASLSAMPAKRLSVLRDPVRAMAESELRITSAILHDNNQGIVDKEKANDIFTKKCRLNEPWSLALSKQAGNSAFTNVAYYFSSAYLIARSDAFVYLPGCVSNGADLSSISNENVSIRLDSNLRKQIQSKQKNYVDALAGLRDSLEKMLNRTK